MNLSKETLARDAISTSIVEARLTDRRSFPTWFLQLKFNSTFRDIWHLVDPSAPDAPHLIAQPPVKPPTIEQLIERLDKQRGALLRAWQALSRADRALQQQPPDPEPATFNDMKEELSFRLRIYTIEQMEWAQQAARYQYIWDWVSCTVDQALLAPHLETLAVTGSSSHALDDPPSEQELSDVRSRIQGRAYGELRRQMAAKGWTIPSSSSSKVAFPGTISA